MWILIAIIALLIVGFIIYKGSCAQPREGFDISYQTAPYVDAPAPAVAGMNSLSDLAEPALVAAPVAPLVDSSYQTVSQPLKLVPESLAQAVDQPDNIVMTPTAYNEARNYYVSRRAGVNNRVTQLPVGDLYSSPVAESVLFFRDGRPLQSMFNNKSDMQTGLFDRLSSIGNRTPRVAGLATAPSTARVTFDTSADPYTGVTTVA